MTLLEPWILIRVLVGIVATLLFTYGAIVAARVLRYRDLDGATEGRLALERHFELAATLVRIGAIAALFGGVLSIVVADRLSGSIRGAMCGYGVVAQNRLGWPAMASSCVAAGSAGALLQLLAFDRQVRGLDLLRPLAIACIVVALPVAVDLGLTSAWLGRLDLTAVASCCSTTLDSARREGTSFWQGPRNVFAWSALAGVPLAIAAALVARARPGRAFVGLAGTVTVLALPMAFGAVVLEVAPHVYEAPDHLCPFCLFKADAYFLGYPLFAAMFLAATSGIGAALAAALARPELARRAFPPFARSRMTRQAWAWALALAVGALPLVRYVAVAPQASLFR